jgi:hypothetical protein
MNQPIICGEGEKNKEKDKVVIFLLALKGIRKNLGDGDSGDAQRAACQPLPVNEDEDENDVESEGRKGQEYPGQAENGFAEEITKDPRNDAGERKRNHERNPETQGEQSRGISANSIKSRMADGKKPGVTIDEIETQSQNNIDADKNEDADIVGILQEKREESEESQDQNIKAMGINPPDPSFRERGQIHTSLPNNPRGRKIKTNIRMAKEKRSR